MADRNFVYVVWRRDGAHKVGMSVNPEQRLRGLGNGSRLIHAVERPGDARAVEQHAHMLLDAKRLDGEWFRVTAGEALAAIQEAARHGDIVLFQKRRQDMTDAVEAEVGRRLTRSEIQEFQRAGRIIASSAQEQANAR